MDRQHCDGLSSGLCSSILIFVYAWLQAAALAPQAATQPAWTDKTVYDTLSSGLWHVQQCLDICVCCGKVGQRAALVLRRASRFAL